MAFFILVKGHVNPFKFSYLKDIEKPRLADTVIHGEHAAQYYNEDDSQKEVYAIEVMSKTIHLLSPANYVGDARRLMEEKNIHHIPLEIDNKIVGFVSSNDIEKESNKKRLVDCMQRTLLCVSESTPLKHIVAVFFKEHIHGIPVVNSDLKVTGIITDSDIYRWLLNNDKFKAR